MPVEKRRKILVMTTEIHMADTRLTFSLAMPSSKAHTELQTRLRRKNSFNCCLLLRE